MMEAQVLLPQRNLLGEGIFWDESLQRMIWFDGFGKELYVCNWNEKTPISYKIPQFIGCAFPSRDHGIVLCLQDGIYRLDLQSGHLQLLQKVEEELPNNRLNDGACDSHGTLWFGSMSMTTNQPDREFEVSGSFYSYSEDGGLKKHFDNVGVSNGIAWNLDETIMYHVDSPRRTVTAFDFDVINRELTNPRVVISMPEGFADPDGMCADDEGMLWIAEFGAQRVSRWNPKTGECLMQVYVPSENVTSCSFGGPQLNQLLITTALIDSPNLPWLPTSGSLFIASTDFKGRKTYPFGN